MIFESLWPLFFLAAVPVIIILYLLKPKGPDYLISSSLLWKKLLKNEQSKTFFEKFVHNILMYLQMLIIALLVIALMSPFIRRDGKGRGAARKILLFDTSASMQHQDASGKSRLEEAVESACDLVRSSENTQFSIVAADALGTKLLAVDIADAGRIVEILRGLSCSDGGGSLIQAQGILDALIGADAISDAGNGTENGADLLVYTDGAGVAEFEELQAAFGKELYVAGEPAFNVANEYTVSARRRDGSYDVMVSLANYGDGEASFDVGLYEDGEELIALSRMRVAPSERATCLFEQVEWRGESMESRLTGIAFAGGQKDSLAADDVSWAVKSRENRIRGLLVGEGNTFLEKAYLAVTGEGIARAANAGMASVGNDGIERESLGADGEAEDFPYNVVIYDVGQMPQKDSANSLIFGDDGGTSTETLKNVVLDMTDCALTAGLSGFSIGVNKAYCFALPEGAESFLEYDGKCAGYYREIDGRKEIVVGFDIRESDFPLRAEFPVFLANAMIYLSDTSWLASHVYYAGEEIALQPWAEPEGSPQTGSPFESRPGKAGLYQLGNGDYREAYVVRFQTRTESDGRKAAASVTDGGSLRLQKVKQALRSLFLLLAIVLLGVEWLVYARQMRYRGRFYFVVRCALFLCVIPAFFGIEARLGSRRTATVFVVDLSDSNGGHLEAMDRYLRDAVQDMPSGNAYGIVAFGGNALVEQFLTAERSYGGLMSLPESSATNFEDAISKALTLLPGDCGARLVVLTDGKETRGDVRNVARALAAGRVEFLTLLYQDEETADAYIDNVTLPAYLHSGDQYSVTVLVESNYDTDAAIELYRGSSLAAQEGVRLRKGSNRFVFRARVQEDAEGGSCENLLVQVKAAGDGCAQNDSYSAYAVVEAPPKLLVILGKGAGAAGLTGALWAAGCDYSTVSVRNAPADIDAMLEYQAMILVNAYIDDLPTGFLEHLEAYVKDYGRGFICCGGEDSFALGGYRDSVLEAVLPVDMMLRGEDESPTMAMAMVIDHSGSMTEWPDGSGASNLDLAIRAATVAVDNLQDSDYVGILTFDDAYEWVSQMGQAQDRAAVKEKIKQIKEGGGTTIKPALQEACRALAECEVSVKHVVLLTDGMGETTEYADVIRDYAESGITLSTVAVGSGADKALLKRLAENCGGRYYYSDASGDIPRIFAQEVFLGGDSYLRNGTFALNVRGGHELTGNLFADGWPALYGYIAATPKVASSPVILEAQKGDPILTVWQYGLGRSVAWNSDVSGEWSGAFAGREDYAQLWKRIADYAAGNGDMGGDSVDVVSVGEQAQIVYRTESYSGKTEILVTAVDPGGNAAQERLYAAAPGRYEAMVPTPVTGLYRFHIRRMEDGEVQSQMTAAAAVQFSDEYKFDASTSAYLRFVEQCGRVITEGDFLWRHIRAESGKSYPLADLLLSLSICLFLADVAMRRFQYVPKFQKLAGIGAGIGRGKAGKPAGLRGGVDASGEMAEGGNADIARNVRENAAGIAGENAACRKRKAAGQPEQSLDTSQLLKKKGDRNL